MLTKKHGGEMSAEDTTRLVAIRNISGCGRPDLQFDAKASSRWMVKPCHYHMEKVFRFAKYMNGDQAVETCFYLFEVEAEHLARQTRAEVVVGGLGVGGGRGTWPTRLSHGLHHTSGSPAVSRATAWTTSSTTLL